MKTMEIKEGETLVIKSDNGRVYHFDGTELKVQEPVKPVDVIKSFRTEAGAKDYFERLSAITPEKFEGAKVVTSLKGFSVPEGVEGNAHIIVETVTKSVVGDLNQHGLVETDEDGALQFTERWGEILKSHINSGSEEFFNNLTALFKSVESSIPALVENTDFGEPEPEKEAISDEQVQTALTSETAPEVASDMPGEALNPDSVRVTFKSWGEAKAWNNPDPDRFYIDSVGYAEQVRLGADAMYVVRRNDDGSQPLGRTLERELK